MKTNRMGMVNVRAMSDIDDGAKGPPYLIIECTAAGDEDTVLMGVKMDSPGQADDMIAALTKCREYIWGPMPNRG